MGTGLGGHVIAGAGAVTRHLIFQAYLLDLRNRADPRTLHNYEQTFDAFQAYLDELGVRPEDAKRAHIAGYLASHPWATSTKRWKLAILKAAYAYAVEELELLDRNPARRVVLPVPGRSQPRTIPNRTLSEYQNQCRSVDDLLLFHALVYTGMRNEELRTLPWANVDLSQNEINVLRGKRGKDRLVPIHPELRKTMVKVGRYTKRSEYLFPGQHNKGYVSNSGLRDRMRHWQGSDSWTPHDYRRTFATSLRRNGVDRSVIEELMGHTRESVFDVYNAVLVHELHEGVMRLYADSPLR